MVEVGDLPFLEGQELFDQFGGVQEGEGVCGQGAAPDPSMYGGSTAGTTQETAQACSAAQKAKRLPVLIGSFVVISQRACV